MAGITGAPDEDGFLQYQRPEGKSGGHGVGWSEIPRYKFRVPVGWEDTPVSIADLGGTEVSLRTWRDHHCPFLRALTTAMLIHAPLSNASDKNIEQ